MNTIINSNKIKLLVLISVVVILIIASLILINEYQPALFKETNYSAILDNEFSRVQYTIKTQENYNDYQKIELIDIGDIEKAVLFVKDGQIQNIPDDYLKDIVENQKEDSGDKIVEIKHYQEFDKFGEPVYENIYIVTVKLASPIDRGEDNMMGEPLKYQFFVFNKYSNLLFNGFSQEIFN